MRVYPSGIREGDYLAEILKNGKVVNHKYFSSKPEAIKWAKRQFADEIVKNIRSKQGGYDRKGNKMKLSNWSVIPKKEIIRDFGKDALRAWRNKITGDALTVEKGLKGSPFEGQYILFPSAADFESGRVIYSAKSYESVLLKATAIMAANDKVY